MIPNCTKLGVSQLTFVRAYLGMPFPEPEKNTTMRMTKQQKAQEQAYDNAFRTLGNCVQFDIMDLGKMQKETLALNNSGQSMEEAFKTTMAKYRKN